MSDSHDLSAPPDSEPKETAESENEASATDTTATAEVKDSSSEIELARKPKNAFLQAFGLSPAQQSGSFPNRKGRKDTYAFWSSQPVTQFEDVASASAMTEGPIDDPKTVDDVREEPIRLAAGFEWCTCDVQDEQVAKEVYKLLTFNYVEDDDMMFRFDYSPAFLKWALLPPGYRIDWLVGVRVSENQRLVGFISAIPADIRINSTVIKMVEINFLCVHKKLRSKRLAPVLIKEITRRVNLQNIWQATYTAGAVLPTPIARCRYWHRSLNPKKLVDVGFSKLSNRMTMSRTIKLFRLPNEPKTPGFRRLKESDCAAVKTLLDDYLKSFKVATQFSLEEIQHWFTVSGGVCGIKLCVHRLVPREGVVDAYVVEDASGNITDFTSFYSLPSSILGHAEHKTLYAAYMYYTVPGATPLADLMNDVLIVAKKTGFDVFNALDILENQTFLKDLKFGEGDGYLQYYLYNWRVAQYMQPNDIGLILL